MTITSKEAEVLALIASGNTQSAIADLLGVSLDAVNCRLDNARFKLNARNTVNAVAICIREKIIL